MGRRRQKALRVLAGIAMMVGFVLITFAVLFQFAAGWGVPYFSFTSDRGSRCTNTFTGYDCSPITLAEVEFYADLDLPDDTTVVKGNYHSTHDYELDAVLEVPAGSAAAALTTLNEAFGKCVSYPTPLATTKGVAKLCTMASTDAIAADGQPVSRLYVVGTGVRADGTRPIAMTIKSR